VTDYSHFTAPLQRQLDQLAASLADGNARKSRMLIQTMRANLDGAEQCLIRDQRTPRTTDESVRLATS
jgi:hypothetical protein